MNLTLNLITFTPVENSKTFGFITKKQEGYHPLAKHEIPKILFESHEDGHFDDIEYLYSDFKTIDNCDFTCEVDLSESLNFARYYYTFLVYEYFLDKADIMYPDFIKSIVIWSKLPSSTYVDTTSYEKFTIKVQIAQVTKQPELILSYDGISEVLKKSLAELGDFPTELFKKIVYKNRIYKYEEILKITSVQNTLYPYLNNPIRYYLNRTIKTKPRENRYPNYLKKIQQFYETFLNNSSFKEILKIDESGFYNLSQEETLYTTVDSNALAFGNDNTHTDPYTGIVEHGINNPPIVGKTHTKFFFIYQNTIINQNRALKLYDKLNEVKNSNYKSFPSLKNLLSFSFDRNSRLTFTSPETLIDELNKYLFDRDFDNDTQYVAIYLSPISKHSTDKKQLEIYFKVKEILLKKNIISQVIYEQRMDEPNFHYHLPNITIALLAKLNGIPWRLNRPPQNELIIGIGAFTSLTLKCKYVGSTFCFKNNGKFLGFDAFPAKNTYLLASSIDLAVKRYIQENKTANRLVIHFYKEINSKELKPILDTLYKLKQDIPVFIITVNKTESKDITAFDTDAPNLLVPISGTIIKVSHRKYLLFNNVRYDKDTVKLNSFPFPVKLSFQCTHKELLDDQSTITELIDQVYQFSRMYWKSVSQQNLPVTIKYPEMVAEMLPHFETDVIKGEEGKSLWFL